MPLGATEEPVTAETIASEAPGRPGVRGASARAHAGAPRPEPSGLPGSRSRQGGEAPVDPRAALSDGQWSTTSV